MSFGGSLVNKATRHRFYHRQSSKRRLCILERRTSLVLVYGRMALGGGVRRHAAQARLDDVRVAKLANDAQDRVQDEARQVLLD